MEYDFDLNVRDKGILCSEIMLALRRRKNMAIGMIGESCTGKSALASISDVQEC